MIFNGWEGDLFSVANSLVWADLKQSIIFQKREEKPEKRKRKSDGLPAGIKCKAVPALLRVNERSFKIRETGTLAMALHFFLPHCRLNWSFFFLVEGVGFSGLIL